MARAMKRIGAMVLVLALLGGLGVGTAGAEPLGGDLSFVPADLVGYVSENDRYYYIEDSKGELISVAGNTVLDRIELYCEQKLQLKGVNIQPSTNPAIYSRCGLDLILTGNNTLGGIKCSPDGNQPVLLTIGGAANSGVGKLTIPSDKKIEADNITVNSGTIVAPSIVITGAALILGGSVNANFDQQPTNNDSEVYLIKIQLDGAGEDKRVSTVTREDDAANYYAFGGAQTDDEGILYFYLPTGTVITEVALTDGGIYVNNGEEAKTTESDKDKPFVFTRQSSGVYTDPYPFAVTPASTDGAYINDANGLIIQKGGAYAVSMAQGWDVANVPILIQSDENVTLTLSGVNVDVSAQKDVAALTIAEKDGSVYLKLAKGTENTFKSGENCAGIQKGTGQLLTIQSDDLTGSLKVIGGKNGAGIGGGNFMDGSLIFIEGGTVTATGGVGGAGIGGGINRSGTNITVSGGMVTATGGMGGAGIGGGMRKSGMNITVSGGTVTATSNADGAGIGCGAGGTKPQADDSGNPIRGTTVTGGSVFGRVPDIEDNCQPVEITLAGAKAGAKVTAADITHNGSALQYGLKDVVAVEGGKLRFFLPVGAVFKSVTAGDKTYMDKQDLTVGVASAKAAAKALKQAVALQPPQFTVDTKTIPKDFFNNYRDGVYVSLDGGQEVTVAPSEDAPDVQAAPINITSAGTGNTLRLVGVNVDAAQFGQNALNFVTGIKDTLSFEGNVNLNGVCFEQAPQCDVTIEVEESAILDSKNVTVVKTKMDKGQAPALVSKIADDLLVRLLPSLRLECGSGSGGGSFRFLKSSESDHQLTLKNCAIYYEGLIPVKGTLTMDADSSLTVGKNSTLIILPGSSVTGAGKLIVQGTVVGQAGAALWYPIDASASGNRAVTLTGVTGGLAQLGAQVTAAAPDEPGFLGWAVSPMIEGLDLTKPTLAFTVDRAYTLEARYLTSVKGVSFDKAKVEVEAGDTAKLKWTVAPKDASDKSVTFVSDHPEIASVDESGAVYGAEAGTAVVTVTTAEGGFTATCEIAVTEAAIRPLDVSKAAIALKTKLKLRAPAGYAGTWSVLDGSKAAIIDNKHVKGKAAGETILTFTVTQVLSKRPSPVRGKVLEVGESASVPLAVRKKKDLVKTVKLGANTIYLAPGEEMTVEPKLKPKGAPDQNMLYQSSDSRVFRVEKGKLIAMGLGKAKLTATASSFVQKKASVVVTDKLQKLIPAQKNIKLEVGGFAQANVSPQPLGLSAVITYESKDEKIAQVTPEGAILGVSKGKTKITARCGNKKAVIKVTVK